MPRLLCGTAPESASDVDLLPLLLRDGRRKARSYGGVFPLYGKLYNRFRRDEIGFFLWPLYSYSNVGRDDEDERSLAALLLLQRASRKASSWVPSTAGGGWGRGGASSFVLWPFFIKDEKGLDTDNPKKSLWAVPFLHADHVAPGRPSTRCCGLSSPI